MLICAQADAEPIETTFELNDTLYAKAEIPPSEEVYLWLGVSISGPFAPLLVTYKHPGKRHARIPHC